MALDEVKVTRAIVESYLESFLGITDVDVALVGAGPANLVAAKRLAEAEVKTILFEKRLSVGGRPLGWRHDVPQDRGAAGGPPHFG